MGLELGLGVGQGFWLELRLGLGFGLGLGCPLAHHLGQQVRGPVLLNKNRSSVLAT